MPVLVMALVGLAVSVGGALLLYNFAHDTTGTAVKWGLIIRRLFIGLFTLGIALALLVSGSTLLVIFGSLMLFLTTLVILYDPTFKPLKGAS